MNPSNSNQSEEVIHYWDYFRSLCNRLEMTRQFIDHSVENGVMRNANVNSFEFQQLIMLASAEFENLCKIICLHIDKSFNVKTSNIVLISKTILNKYPKITEVKVGTDYCVLQPLNNWAIIKSSNQETENVIGIEWWKANNSIKHESFNNFHLATLENAVNSLASLMVVELYLIKLKINSVNESLEKPCSYFENLYESARFIDNEKSLPDF